MLNVIPQYFSVLLITIGQKWSQSASQSRQSSKAGNPSPQPSAEPAHPEKLESHITLSDRFFLHHAQHSSTDSRTYYSLQTLSAPDLTIPSQPW